jgi:hypothetical protein
MEPGVKRNLLVTAACVLSFGMALGTWSSADAASKATIRTYTEHATVSFKGVGGSAKGSLWFVTDSESVVLAPHLALKSLLGTYVVYHGRASQSAQQFYIVGKHSFTKNDSHPWVVRSLAASDLTRYGQQLNLYISLAKFSVLHGVKRLSATHYAVTGSLSQVISFLNWEYGLTTRFFGGTGIKTVTVSLWLDSSGRPAEFIASAHSSTYVVSITETFSNYNQPLTIHAP